MRHLSILICLLALLLLLGCGGGGGGAETTALKYQINWGARSKAIDAPNSALSVAIRLTGAAPNGADFISAVDRQASLAAYTQDVVSTAMVRRGTFPMTATFYANAGGTGAVVGLASANVTIASDGSGIGQISVSKTVKAISVSLPAPLEPTESKQLTFLASDAESNPVAVTPGSGIWTIVDGAEFVSITADGIVTAIAPGTANVRVTLDGLNSAPTPVTVTLPAAFQNPGFETPALPVNTWKQDDDVLGSMWDGDPHRGIANGNGSWGAGGHSGAQYGYLQSSTVTPSHGSFEQTISNMRVGRTYKVRFFFARRNGNVGGNSGAPINLYLDGDKILGPTSPAGDGSWTSLESPTFVATKTSYHFKFQCDLPPSVADTATLIDDVELVTVP